MNNAVEKILTPNFNGEKDAYGTKDLSFCSKRMDGCELSIR